MSTAANVVVGLIALVHVYIMILEMFLWDKPYGLRAFGQKLEAARRPRSWPRTRGSTTDSWPPASLGLYLGEAGTSVKIFFLTCVLIAGLYGAATANRKILFIQAIPAAIGLALVLLSRG